MSRCGFRIDVDGSPVYVCGQADMSDEDMEILTEMVRVAQARLGELGLEDQEARIEELRRKAQRRR